ncbi:MAG: cytochrome c maturation protein CcmE [Bacteroidia bacterium]|nr:cytochrome c maturation protein CcmE [Bacteroidia bacterium]
MKKGYIIAFIAIIAAISIILSASEDVSSYVSFTEAARTTTRVKISGELNRDKEIEYDPFNAPNIVKFHMLDYEGVSNEVILKQEKPQDFELSESVVVTGQMQNGVFIADEVLLKCPSKYKDEELKIRGES